MGCVIVHDGIVIGRGHNQTESLQDATAHDETPALPYTGFGSAFRYEFSDMVYQGSTATWESAQPRPEARKLQYRLYYELNYQVSPTASCISTRRRRMP